MSNFSDVIIKWTICDQEDNLPAILHCLAKYFEGISRFEWLHISSQYMVVARINSFDVVGGQLADGLPWFDEESLYTNLAALKWHNRSQVLICSMDEEADKFSQWTLAELDALKAETEKKRQAENE